MVNSWHNMSNREQGIRSSEGRTQKQPFNDMGKLTCTTVGGRGSIRRKGVQTQEEDATCTHNQHCFSLFKATVLSTIPVLLLLLLQQEEGDTHDDIKSWSLYCEPANEQNGLLVVKHTYFFDTSQIMNLHRSPMVLWWVCIFYEPEHSSHNTAIHLAMKLTYRNIHIIVGGCNCYSLMKVYSQYITKQQIKCEKFLQWHILSKKLNQCMINYKIKERWECSERSYETSWMG